MKKILALAAMICALAACGTVRQSPEERAQTEAKIQERLDSRRFKVDIDYVRPARGGARPANSTYSLTVNGDKVISYLPYFGVAYNIPYGGGKGLNFEGEITDYQDTPIKKDRRRIIFQTSSGEDRLIYQLDVFGNGKASLNVRSGNRDTIDFDGYLDPDTDPAEQEKE
ncbi:MAG: DUF4251 domain-containing protein [Bacteroidales bacterium]|nr:DUF4251 domain-containing protein [Bacteroidales bacterium]